jgi:hypothetical protein
MNDFYVVNILVKGPNDVSYYKQQFTFDSTFIDSVFKNDGFSEAQLKVQLYTETKKLLKKTRLDK